MTNCKVIAVANQKGGVGKSTSVYCIGAGLVMDGRKVLLVDVDPQGDLTKMLGQRRPHDLPYTLYYNRVLALLLNVEGVENFASLTVNGGTADVTIQAGEIPVLGEVSVT